MIGSMAGERESFVGHMDFQAAKQGHMVLLICFQCHK